MTDNRFVNILSLAVCFIFLLDGHIFAKTTPEWQLVFSDNGSTTRWQDLWFLDGEEATVRNTPQGLSIEAGAREGAFHEGHTVLWTKRSFSGNVRLEYDFMRTDSCLLDETVILYLLAEGRDENPYQTDIYEWRELRKIPYMHLYFWGMKAAHISYAARSIGHDDYVRARIYPVWPGKTSFAQTAVKPSYENVGIFAPGEWVHISVIKNDKTLTFSVTDSKGETTVFCWTDKRYLTLQSGRIGFRQMWRRNALYKNMEIFEEAKK